ncbi:hypothetical protein NED98_10525 [Sphingomonas sp. MMSM20]|uniref:hypothetical protein n=1 Tax=Sphingomonas lycopersici TaxID=2951807 RepID=UPI002238CBD3|nr:hypothetical protein [Sphingomonas lycopersici]MCW6530682.1 hypothetical protein [Sphingomonas lycopersici]
MPQQQKLRVYRTAIGFHDAYVAAPSQKAALKAWGSDADLFARGVAERVEDPDLMREPLEHPGKIVRRLRGSVTEQLAALPKSPPSPARRPQKEAPRPRAQRKANVTSAKPAKPEKPPKLKPDASALRAAEQRLEAAEAQHASAREALARRQAEIDRERRGLEKQHDAERRKLEREVARARSAYDRAIRAWRE